MSTLFVSPLFVSLSASMSKHMGSVAILQNDPYGLIVAVISIAVVLSALMALAVIIAIFSKVVMTMSAQTAAEATPAATTEGSSTVAVDAGENGEVVAAIALALKLHEGDLHDQESEILTINTVARAYSPWSSKIHGLTNQPR